jgi:hypothetical protein
MSQAGTHPSLEFKLRAIEDCDARGQGVRGTNPVSSEVR